PPRAPARGPARPGPGRPRGGALRRPRAGPRGGADHRLASGEARGHSPRRARQGPRPAARRRRGDAPGDRGAVPGHRQQDPPRTDRQAPGFIAGRARSPLHRAGDRDLRAQGLCSPPGTRGARPVRWRLGTRGSRLALAQADQVAAALRAVGAEIEIVSIRPPGDRLAQVALAELGGKALFVKEIEDGLLDKRIDLAVHSLKDMPAVLPAGLVLGAFPAREDPRDTLITR